MKLDPVSLRLFIAAIEESAIAPAVAREHMAPWATSRRLANLEAALQVDHLSAQAPTGTGTYE